jgi:hypothetical protein
LAHSHATASAAARHGFTQAQTFPKRIVSGTSPSQKITQTNVGAMFVPTERSPTSAAANTSTKSPKPIAPNSTRRAARGTRNSPFRCSRWRSGVRQSAPSAANESTSTAAPP